MTTYYKNIDELPIHNFNQVISTGEMQYLVKKGVVDSLVETVWEEILEEFTAYVGFSRSYQDYMRFKKEAALLTCRAYLEDNKVLLNFARIAEIQANDAMQTEEVDFHKSVALISKHQGYRIDTKTTSVREFYAIIKSLENGKEAN